MTTPYGRDSRYRRTPTVSRVDHTGRTLQVDDARMRPPTLGRFTHTVDGGDRLDGLGQRYYDKPHKWWPIADANPDVASPLALLGLEPIVAVRLTLDDPGDRLWELLAALRDQTGVEDVTWGDTTVTIIYNRATTDVAQLADAVAAFHPRAAVPVTRAGKRIVVPPETAP